ncbi:hypothetical protein EDC04DRAFT_2508803, partial [Pisolithus marmoratus]
VLGITCDNVSLNDTMTEYMGELVAHFSSTANRIQCVLHITNLVAKSLLRPFDSQKGRADWGEEDTD